MATKKGVKARGNGQGSAIKIRTNCWKAIAVVGYKADGNPIRRTKTGFLTKSDALAYCQTLKRQKPVAAEKMTLREAYERWFETLTVSASTMSCYKSGFGLFAPVDFRRLGDLTIDELQTCLDKSTHGVRTQQNAKTALGLIYKWAIPRGYVDGVNLASYLHVDASPSDSRKKGFTPEQLEKIKKGIGTVPYADYIYINCLTGFRPGELFALTKESYHADEHYLQGGAKTAAGKNRIVTVSPKILFLVKLYANRAQPGGPLFPIGGKKPTETVYRRAFDNALRALGIDDPELTPHCCRHTFATLLKNAKGADTDKLRLMGHTSVEMLKYYQDTRVEDLQRITDAL